MVSITAASTLVFVAISSALKYGYLSQVWASPRHYFSADHGPVAFAGAGLVTLLIAWTTDALPSGHFREAAILAGTYIVATTVHAYSTGTDGHATAAPMAVLLAQFAASQWQANSATAVVLAIIASVLAASAIAGHYYLRPLYKRDWKTAATLDPVEQPTALLQPRYRRLRNGQFIMAVLQNTTPPTSA